MAETVIKDKAELLSKITKTPSALKKADPKLLKSKKFIKEAVAVNPKAITFADADLLEDYQFLLSLAKDYPLVYRHLPKKVRDTPEMAIIAVCGSAENIPHVTGTAKKYIVPFNVTSKYRKNRNFVMLVASSPNLIDTDTIKPFRDDKEIMLAAVASYSDAYHWASDRLKADIDILRATYISGKGFFWGEAKAYRKDIVSDRETVIKAMSGAKQYFVEPEYENDVEIVAIAIHNSPSYYKNLSVAKRDNEIITKNAVSKQGMMLEFASECLRDNEDIVALAVKNDGCALEFASERLRDNDNIVALAIEQNNMAFEYASERIRSSKDVVTLVVSRDPYIFDCASEHLRNDKEFVKELAKDYPQIFVCASEGLRDDMALVKDLLQYDTDDILGGASDRILDTKEIFHYVYQLPNKRGDEICYASERLCDDKDFILDLLADINGTCEKFEVLQYLSDTLQDDEEIVAACVMENTSEFMDASERLQNDPDFALTLIINMGGMYIYDYLSEEVKTSKEIRDYIKKMDLKKRLGL